MRVTRSAFTFVELIVVLVIIAILSTIGFTVYESYLWTGRDTKRIVQMKELQTAFQEYSFREKLPLPDTSIQLRASGASYAYQWYLSEDILKQLALKANVYDDTIESFPVYTLWTNQKDFQFLTFLEDPASNAFLQNITYAADMRTLFPKVFGKPLGVLLEQETNIPLHALSSVQTAWYYDIITGTGQISAYLSEQKILESGQDDLRQLLPQNSCNRLMELGYSKWSWEYVISPDGVTKVQVYCDMDSDGGGWTMIMRHANPASWYSWNFWWKVSVWNVSNRDYPYSMGEILFFIPFNEIMYRNYEPYSKTKNDFIFVYDVPMKELELLTNTMKTFTCRTIKKLYKDDPWFTWPTDCSQNITQLWNINIITWYQNWLRITSSNWFNVNTQFWNNMNWISWMILVR